MASIYDGFKSRNTIFSFKDSIASGSTAAEFAVDATLSFVTSLSGSVTNFPVEDGSTISDHFQANPLVVDIHGFISESPSDLLLSIAGGIASSVVGGQFKGLSSTFATAATAAAIGYAANGGTDSSYHGGKYNSLLTSRGYGKDNKNFPKRAMLGLIKLFNAKSTFTIRSFFDTRIYTDMIIESLNFPHSAKIGDSLEFKMRAKQIKTVRSFTTGVSEFRMKDPVGSSATSSVEKGKNATKASESFLSQGTDAFADFIKGG